MGQPRQGGTGPRRRRTSTSRPAGTCALNQQSLSAPVRGHSSRRAPAGADSGKVCDEWLQSTLSLCLFSCISPTSRIPYRGIEFAVSQGPWKALTDQSDPAERGFTGREQTLGDDGSHGWSFSNRGLFWVCQTTVDSKDESTVATDPPGKAIIQAPKAG